MVELDEPLSYHHWRELQATEKVKEGKDRMLVGLELYFHVEKVFLFVFYCSLFLLPLFIIIAF